MTDEIQHSRLFRVEVSLIARHMLGHSEHFNFLADGGLNDFFQGVGGMAAELAGV